MCCGDDKTPASTTVTQGGLPGYVEPYFKDLLSRTQFEVEKPYQAFPEQRLAGIGQATQAGLTQLAGTTTPGDPAGFTTAGGVYSDIAGRDPSVTQAQLAGLESYADPDVAARYADPYIQNVLDVQQARLGERFAESEVARGARAARAGALGSSGATIERSIAAREHARQQNELDAIGLSQAYTTGADIFGQEQQRELALRELNTARQSGNVERQMAASEALTNLGESSQSLAEKKARTLTGIGGTLDEQRQLERDLAYRDFEKQRDFGRGGVDFYSGILQGVPIPRSSETQQFTAPPNVGSQIAGLGLGLGSLYGAGVFGAAHGGGLVRPEGFVRRIPT